MIKDENTRITITIPKKLHRKLKKDAAYEDRSVSNMVSKILKEYYKMNKED
ncbi:ribbon-helix-helix domain-containing protein [Clostridium sp. DL1XJH146]